VSGEVIVKGAGGKSLGRSDLTRYDRHLLIPELREEGQKRLKGFHAIITGVGGLDWALDSQDGSLKNSFLFNNEVI
jgi:hypothetical protein